MQDPSTTYVEFRGVYFVFPACTGKNQISRDCIGSRDTVGGAVGGARQNTYKSLQSSYKRSLPFWALHCHVPQRRDRLRE